MQTYNITQIRADLGAVLHGTTLNKVQNIDGLILRACREVSSDIDLKETVRKVNLTVYKDVYDYVCPSDIKGNKIIDIHPVNTDFNVSIYGQRYNQDFNRNVASGGVNDNLNYDYDQYQRAIKINAKQLTQPIIVDKATIITSFTGTVTNLVTDTINYKVGGASVRGSASTGQYIQKTFATPLSLSSHFNLSTIFFDVYVSATVSSIEFRLGFDLSNYYKWTITTDSLNMPLTEGWHTIKMDWANVGVVGSPTASIINSFRVTFTNTTPIVFNINNFSSNLGKRYEISYYSESMFRNNLTGSFESSPSSDSSFVNASNESYNLILNKIALYSAQQVQGESQSADATFFSNEYSKLLAKHKLEYKSQIQKPQSYYYKIWKGDYPSNSNND